MLLSDTDILKAVEDRELSITPFDQQNLQPASYDLTAGDEAVVRGGALNVKEQGYVQVPRGSTAIVTSLPVRLR